MHICDYCKNMSMIMRWKWRNRRLSSCSVSGFMLKYFECSWNNSIQSWNGYYVWLNENKYFIWGEVKYTQVVNFIIIFLQQICAFLTPTVLLVEEKPYVWFQEFWARFLLHVSCFMGVFFFLHLKFMFCFWVGNTLPLCQLIDSAIKRMK